MRIQNPGPQKFQEGMEHEQGSPCLISRDRGLSATALSCLAAADQTKLQQEGFISENKICYKFLISAEPWGGGHCEHQADAVHDGGQLLDDRGMEPGWAAGRPGQAPRLLPALGPSSWLSCTRGQQL